MIAWGQSAVFRILSVSSQQLQMWHPPLMNQSSSLNETTVQLENLWIVSRALHADVTLPCVMWSPPCQRIRFHPSACWDVEGTTIVKLWLYNHSWVFLHGLQVNKCTRGSVEWDNFFFYSRHFDFSQLFLVTLPPLFFCVPMNHDTMTVSQYAQYQNPQTEAAQCNEAIINLIIYAWDPHVKMSEKGPLFSLWDDF